MHRGKTVWRRTLLGSAALFASTQPLWAQDQAPGQGMEAEEQEAIVVTGSRIARKDLESASPMAVIGAEEFKLSGAVNVEQVLNTLPQVIPGNTAFSNNPGGGTATVDLRGIGQQRTLVLVNGRRYMFFSPLQTVDLNTIPQSLVAGVEVVTGGASAVYGSDAIAGVVNFKLRDDLNGFEAASQFNITDKGDANRWNASLALGTQFADGAGHVTIFADYLYRKPLMGDARAFSSTVYGDKADHSGLIFTGNTTVPQGRFLVATPTFAIPAGNGLGAVTLPHSVGNFGTTNGSFYNAPGQSRPFTTADGYNFYPDNFLQTPQNRWLIGGYGEYAVNDWLNTYFEMTFANNRVNNELAATPVTGTFGIATNNPFLSPADQVSILQIDANETAIDAARVARGLAPVFNNPGVVNMSVFRRMNDVISRENRFERNAYRFVGGARGEISSNLNYDAYYLFSRTALTNSQKGNISRSAFAAELLANRLNIFGPNTISPASAQRISINSTNTGESQLQVANGSISGNFGGLGLGADELGFALGAEWRAVSSSITPDTALSSGDVIGFNGGQPTKGGYSAKEIFGELLVPVVAERPFFHNLTFRAAARYAHYSLSGVGGTFTYAGGGEWAPIRDITLRAQYQRAIRAPSVAELFGGQGQGFPSATDPCSSRNTATRTAAVTALCIATGVPAPLVYAVSVQPNSQIEGLFGGNPNLAEEKSDTITFGAVIRPSVVPGLNITVDYYNIKVDDYIATLGGSVDNTLKLCYYQIQDVNSRYCQAIRRNPLNGQIGTGFVVTTLNENISTLETSGIDIQADYTKTVNFGLIEDESKIKFSMLATITTKADFTAASELPDVVTDCKGTFGQSCGGIYGDPVPKFRASARVAWMDGPLSTSIKYRYVGAVTHENIVAGSKTAADYYVDRLKPKSYFDISFSYDVNERLNVSAGMNNIFDVTPQILPDADDEQSGTYPSSYDVLGRDFFISAKIRL